MTGEDKKNINKKLELTSTYAYLTIAKRCVDNARMHLTFTDMRVEEKSLDDMFDVLNTVISNLGDEFYKEE